MAVQWPRAEGLRTDREIMRVFRHSASGFVTSNCSAPSTASSGKTNPAMPTVPHMRKRRLVSVRTLH